MWGEFLFIVVETSKNIWLIRKAIILLQSKKNDNTKQKYNDAMHVYV